MRTKCGATVGFMSHIIYCHPHCHHYDQNLHRNKSSWKLSWKLSTKCYQGIPNIPLMYKQRVQWGVETASNVFCLHNCHHHHYNENRQKITNVIGAEQMWGVYDQSNNRRRLPGDVPASLAIPSCSFVIVIIVLIMMIFIVIISIIIIIITIIIITTTTTIKSNVTAGVI